MADSKSSDQTAPNTYYEKTWIQGQQLCHFLSATYYIEGQFLKERICSLRSKFFPVRVDPFFEGFSFPGKKTRRHKSRSSL